MADETDRDESTAFAGDRKHGASILGRFERRFIDWGVPRIPGPILSHHLTALTALWSVGMVFFGWLAQIAYYGIGPTEIRIGYIALNTFVWIVGTAIFGWGVPVVVALNAVAFAVLAAQTSNELWRIDYEANVDGAPR